MTRMKRMTTTICLPLILPRHAAWVRHDVWKDRYCSVPVVAVLSFSCFHFSEDLVECFGRMIGRKIFLIGRRMKEKEKQRRWRKIFAV